MTGGLVDDGVVGWFVVYTTVIGAILIDQANREQAVAVCSVSFVPNDKDRGAHSTVRCQARCHRYLIYSQPATASYRSLSDSRPYTELPTAKTVVKDDVYVRLSAV